MNSDIYQNTYLFDILHAIAQSLLVPTIIIIMLLILASLAFIGQIIVEFFTERRHFKQNMPEIINAINDSDYASVTTVIIRSHLLKYQKSALAIVSKNMGLPEDPLFALAQSSINGTEKRYQRRLAWTDTISKIAPMLGLMGTLIPLGPGIVALGANDITVLSQSLGIAFDATVSGLACAVAALIISRIRSGWYGEYINTLESLMSCVLDKATQARASGVRLKANFTGDPLKDFVSPAELQMTSDRYFDGSQD